MIIADCDRRCDVRRVFSGCPPPRCDAESECWPTGRPTLGPVDGTGRCSVETPAAAVSFLLSVGQRFNVTGC